MVDHFINTFQFRMLRNSRDLIPEQRRASRRGLEEGFGPLFSENVLTVHDMIFSEQVGTSLKKCEDFPEMGLRVGY